MSKSEILKEDNSINKKEVNKYIVEDGETLLLVILNSFFSQSL